MIPVQMSCQIAGCGYRADWSGEPIAQWNEMQYHLDNDHDFRRKGMALMSTAFEQMWETLDSYVKYAFENPDDTTFKLKARGFAECMSLNFSFNRQSDEWDSADKVIAASVACYEADKTGSAHPPRYGINKGFRVPGANDEVKAGDLKTDTAIKKKLASIKDQLKAAIAGGIDAEMLATTYHCSVDEINEAVNAE